MALPFSVRSGSAIFSYCAAGETFKKCPAELGIQIRRNHGVNCNAYRYQARITGSAFDTEECRWSDEWNWLGIPFDGFQPRRMHVARVQRGITISSPTVRSGRLKIGLMDSARWKIRSSNRAD
ncbi:hypothetical protein EGY20_22105 [Burkholderia multivorans]|nr:hypothetical protein EGY20_22105 [Burkholderia multivorans]